MRNEKAEALESDGSNKNLTEKLTMNNLPNFQFKSNADGDRRELLEQTKQNKFQFEIDVSDVPVRKHLNTITCHDCRHQSELAGYRLAFVPLCECCRIEREVKITGNRFERRHQR